MVLTLFFFYFAEISGPIILDTYRVIADFEKTSKHELNVHTGDLVEIVEKNQNGEKDDASWYLQMNKQTNINLKMLKRLQPCWENRTTMNNYMFYTSSYY